MQLYKKVGDGEAVAVGAAEQVGTADGWSKTWSDLPVYENGTAIKYYVIETLPEDSEYTKSGDGEGTGILASDKENLGTITITNSYESEQTEIAVTKIWNDNFDEEKLRPESITVSLLANGEVVAEQKITSKDGWVFTFKELPVYEDGKKITYTVEEKPVADYEAPVITGSAEKGFAIKNTHVTQPKPTPVPYYFKFTFTKLWQGDHGDSIDWVLYKPDGTVAHKKFDKKVLSENEWYYEAWFATDAEYYILETVPEGYKVRYENVGAHAGETDRCYNGGTIINYKVPKTGDSANLWLWAVMVLAGAGAVCGVVVYSKKKKEKK